MKKLLCSVLTIVFVVNFCVFFGSQIKSSAASIAVDTQMITVGEGENESSYMVTEGGYIHSETQTRVLEHNGFVVYRVDLNDAVTAVRVDSVGHYGMSNITIQLSKDGENWFDYINHSEGLTPGELSSAYFKNLNMVSTYKVLKDNASKILYLKVSVPQDNYIFLKSLTITGVEAPTNIQTQGFDVVGSTYGFSENYILGGINGYVVLDANGRTIDNGEYFVYCVDLHDDAESFKIDKLMTGNGLNFTIDISKDNSDWSTLAKFEADAHRNGEFTWNDFSYKDEAAAASVLTDNADKIVYIKFSSAASNSWISLQSFQISATLKQEEAETEKNSYSIRVMEDESRNPYVVTTGGRWDAGSQSRVLESGDFIVYKVDLADNLNVVHVDAIDFTSALGSVQVALSSDGSTWMDYVDHDEDGWVNNGPVNRIDFTTVYENAAYNVLKNNEDNIVYIKIFSDEWIFLKGITVSGIETPVNLIDPGMDVVEIPGISYGSPENRFLVQSGMNRFEPNNGGRILENTDGRPEGWVVYRFDLHNDVDSVKIDKLVIHNGNKIVIEVSKDGNNWLPLAKAEKSEDFFQGVISWGFFTTTSNENTTAILADNPDKVVFVKVSVESGGWIFLKALQLATTGATNGGEEEPTDPTKPVIDGKLDENFYKDVIDTTPWEIESYIPTDNTHNASVKLYVYLAEDSVYFYGIVKDPMHDVTDSTGSKSSHTRFGYVPDPSGVVKEDQVDDPAHVTYPIFTLTKGSTNMEVMKINGSDGSYTICDVHDPTFDPTFYDWANNKKKFTTFVDAENDTYGFECVVPLKDGVPEVWFKMQTNILNEYQLSNGGQGIFGSDWYNWNRLDIESGIIYGGAYGSVLDKSVTITDEATGISMKGNGLKNAQMTVTMLTSGAEYDTLNSEIKASSGKLLKAFLIDLKKDGEPLVPDADGYALSIPADQLDLDGEYEVYYIENGTPTYLGTLLDTTGESPYVVAYTNGYGYFALSQLIDDDEEDGGNGGDIDDNDNDNDDDNNNGENPQTGSTAFLPFLLIPAVASFGIIKFRKANKR